jgi:hypothetical protein
MGVFSLKVFNKFASELQQAFLSKMVAFLLICLSEDDTQITDFNYISFSLSLFLSNFLSPNEIQLQFEANIFLCGLSYINYVCSARFLSRVL